MKSKNSRKSGRRDRERRRQGYHCSRKDGVRRRQAPAQSLDPQTGANECEGADEKDKRTELLGPLQPSIILHEEKTA